MAESERRARILLAEDERVTRTRLMRLLENAEYEVDTADTGTQALERIRNATPCYDAVLLDVWMPEMSGLEVLRSLKRQPTERRPPVVMITADDTPQTLIDAVKNEAYKYIKKPVDAKGLLEVVETTLRDASTQVSHPIEVISAKPHWIELDVPCDRGSVERIQTFMSHLDTDLDEASREAIGRVFREMVLNAVEWGGKLDPNRHIRITYLRAKRMILYRIADPGEGFRFEEIDHAAVANPEGDPMRHAEVRDKKGIRSGGFGILMSQTLADELLYNEAQNEVVFVKYLDETSAEEDR
jgi:DNA-binding response OmpR family regulator